MSHWVVLTQLWRREGYSQAELQELLHLGWATINGLVQRIARREWIQRIFLTRRG
jgi:DNA-binding MarR family transcriptional regulator